MISLQEAFLIASPNIKDPFFKHTVIYLQEYHSTVGAFGFIINKPIKSNLGDLLQHLEVPYKGKRVENHPLLLGGPVSPYKGFLLKRTRVQKENLTEIEIGSFKNDLFPLANGKGLRDTLVILGCVRWKAGQLEEEIRNNQWLLAPLSEETLFAAISNPIPPGAMGISAWHTAAEAIGVYFSRFSLSVGHA